MPEKTFQASYFTDYVGRRRKLSAGAIRAIQSEFADGAATRTLAERYGVSTSLILTVCYNTRQNQSQKETK